MRERGDKGLGVLMVLYFISIFIWVLVALGVLFDPEPRVSISDVGAFGDSFGLITSVATVGSLLLLMRTASLQMQELGLQREESRLSREATEDQARSASNQLELRALEIEAIAIRETMTHLRHRYDERYKSFGGDTACQEILRDLEANHGRLNEIALDAKVFIEAAREAE
jgi:hypothetical protein